ncbi:MAG: prepilin peptidase [Candidatus Pacebacteria bacterium]|nr:prepilin peptidase [Candidatus Paceibacterota bacterium]
MIFLPIIVFGLGLIIGSFLNVVILRLNTGRSVAKGRSKCARCSNTLAWYELIPVLSFLHLRGKCKTCKNPISFQYPVVELVTALTFIILYTKIILSLGFNFVGIVSFLGSATVASLLIVILAYDIKHKIIPDKIVYPFIIVSLISVFWRHAFTFDSSLIPSLLAGPALSAPFFFLWFFSKGRAMGFGDVKLTLGIGWLLGLAGSLAVFFLSFWLGAIVGLLLMASSKASIKSEVAFAPFLIVAVFIVSIFGVTLQSLFPIW